MVDSIIYANLLPILISYWSLLVNNAKHVLVFVIVKFVKFVKDKYIKQFNNADIVFYTEINSRNSIIFNYILDNILLNEEVTSDKGSIYFMDYLSTIMKKKMILKMTNMHFDTKNGELNMIYI